MLRVVALLAGVLIALLLIEAAPAAVPQDEDAVGIGLPAEPEGLEPGGPELRLAGPGGESARAVLLETRLQLRVAGLLAHATLEQRFRNASDDWREAEYLLPLPEDAALRYMEMSIGDRRIIGEIREREEARQVYAAAREAGERTALLEQQRPNLFTSRIANVAPGEEVAVRLEILLPVHYRDGRFSLRFPTTVTPRYMPGAPLRAAATEAGPWLDLAGSGWAGASSEVPDAPLISALQYAEEGSDVAPLNPLRLEVELDAGVPLADLGALYHDLDIERSGDAYRMKLRDGVTEMDRDLVLQWTPRPGRQPQAALFRESFDGEDFALLMLLPPQAGTAAQRLPRELLLVLDVSGSMQGESIRQARDSVLHALDTLRPGDHVNLLLFNDGLRMVYPRAQPVSGELLEELRQLVRRIDAGGGTEMLPALAAALRMPAPELEGEGLSPLRQLLFLTDGAVGNEAALLELIARELGEARIYTVGIGAAPNGYFMRHAAQAGRGEALFIARSEEVAPQLDALFRRIAAPMARDLSVSWPQPVEAFPEPVPDLYAGQPLLQTVRLSGPMQGGTLRVAGSLAGEHWEREISLTAAQPAAGVATNWARRKQEALLNALHRGESREEVRSQVLPLALRFSLASPFTSFVARELEPARPQGLLPVGARIPNTRPAGQAPQRFAFPQTATSAGVKLYLGLLAAFLALLLWVMSRPEAGAGGSGE